MLYENDLCTLQWYLCGYLGLRPNTNAWWELLYCKRTDIKCYFGCGILPDVMLGFVRLAYRLEDNLVRYYRTVGLNLTKDLVKDFRS